MEKEQEGIVLEVDVDKNIAKLKASRHNDCENCGSCPGSNAMVLTARNPVGAKRGQRVMFEIEQTSMLKSALVVYAVPLFGTFAGVIAGWYAGSQMGIDDPVWFQIGGGSLAFLLSIAYVKYYDRKASTNVEMQPVITKVLSS